MSLTESRKQARMKIAGFGLAWLSQQTQPQPRKSIFTPGNNSTKAEQLEGNANKWQQDLLHRLEQDKVIKKIKRNDQIFYQASDNKIEGIVHNFAKGDGSILSSYIWPKSKASNKTELKKAATDPVLAKTQDPETDMDRLSELFVFFNNLVKVLKENQKDFVKQFDALKDQTSQINQGISSTNSELIKKIGAYNKRLETVEKNVLGLRQVIDSNQALMKELGAGIQTVKNTAEDYQIVVKNSKELQATVQKLIEMHKRTENNKLLDISRRLEAHTSEAHTLREILMEIISDVERQ